MSIASDLAGAFAEVELTHPVTCGASSTRAFFDRAGATRKAGGVPIQIETDTLYIQAGVLGADLAQEAQITVGALGADAAAGGTAYRIAQIQLIEDGQVQAIALGGGAS